MSRIVSFHLLGEIENPQELIKQVEILKRATNLIHRIISKPKSRRM